MRRRHDVAERAPSTGSYGLRALGTLDLHRPDGTVAEAVLSQPKRLALLIYLAVAKRGALCRRDTVLGVFWPDYDQERARAALRRALHFLRRELGNGVILGRGDDEIGVDPRQLSSDVGDFVTASENGDWRAALRFYAGDFLDGFYVSDAPEFEQWTEATRRELKGQAVRAAERLTRNALAAHDPRQALTRGRQWVRLAPRDEAATRALMTALDGAGERANALGAYDELVAQLRALELEPSSETQSLASTIRQKSGEPNMDPVSVSLADEVRPPSRARWRWRRLAIGVASVGALASVVVLGRGFGAGSGSSVAGIEPRWIIVAEFDGSADSTIRSTAHDLLTIALDQSPVTRVLPADDIRRGLAIAQKPDTARLTEELALELAVRGRIPAVVAGEVNRVGSTYALSFRVINADSGTVVTAVQELARGDDAVIPGVDAAARALVKGVEDDPAALGPIRPLIEVMTPSMAAFQLYMANVSTVPYEDQIDNLREAVTIDPGFSQAWAALSMMFSNTNRFDSARAAAEKALSNPKRPLKEISRLYTLGMLKFAEHDYEAAYQHLRQRWEIAGKDPIKAANVAVVLMFLGEWEQALETAQLTRSAPFGRPLNLMMNIHLGPALTSGDFADAQEVLDEIAETMPNERRPAMRFHVARAEWAQAESLAVEVTSDPTTRPAVRAEAMSVRASALAARGKVEAAATLLVAGQDMVPELGYAESADRTARNGFTQRLRLLRLISGTPRHNRFEPDTVTVNGRLEASLDAALAGEADLARTHLSVLRNLPLDSVAHLRSAPDVVEAVIVASEADWDSVIRVLTPLEAWAWPHRVRFAPDYGGLILYLLAQAHEAKYQPDSAATYYQILGSPVQLRRRNAGGSAGLVYSFAHQRLVVLYARMDRIEDAERHWKILSETFTNPDSGLVHLVDEAREAVARAR